MIRRCRYPLALIASIALVIGMSTGAEAKAKPAKDEVKIGVISGKTAPFNGTVTVVPKVTSTGHVELDSETLTVTVAGESVPVVDHEESATLYAGKYTVLTDVTYRIYDANGVFGETQTLEKAQSLTIKATPQPKCTKTSTGKCIAGGQFCPQKSYGKTGYDANGTAWVCKGDHAHPHWE